jgi:hypothetical protein
MRRANLGFTISVLLLGSLACGLFPPATPTPDADLLEEAVAVTLTYQALTQTVPPPPTHTPDLQCPVPPGSPDQPDLSTTASLPIHLLDYLNAGGSIEALNTLIQTKGLSPQDGISLAQMDFTGDGMQDVALSIADLESSGPFVSGSFLIFVCSDSSYMLNYASPVSTELGMPVLQAAEDLNGDSTADLLISRSRCGAHTCFIQAEVLLWHGATFENRLQGPTDDLPSPILELYPTTTGAFEITITAMGIGSVGAGPYRRTVRTWSWDAETERFTTLSETALPSTFRIHVLHDADQAAVEGNYQTALSLYNQVIEDNKLDDWILGENGRANLSAYAMFRRVLTHLQANEPDQAQAAYEILNATFSEGMAGLAYADLAEVFWSEYKMDFNLAAACGAAQAYSSNKSDDILNPLNYGYANRIYSAFDICPVNP